MLARDLNGYNGGITAISQPPPSSSELAIALTERLSIENYLLDSIFTHKSARYALEGALNGFATESALGALPNPNIIMFSERNSEALDAADNSEYGSVNQDDYDTWVGEAALVRWGGGKLTQSGYAVDDSTRSRCCAGRRIGGLAPQPAVGNVVNSIAR